VRGRLTDSVPSRCLHCLVLGYGFGTNTEELILFEPMLGHFNAAQSIDGSVAIFGDKSVS